MKTKLMTKEILKLNLYYIIYQCGFFVLGYLGFYDAFIKNCYGAIFCNADIVLFLQVILTLLFLFQARTRFINLVSTTQRFYNLVSSSILLIILINYFLYLITHPKHILPMVLFITNALFLIIFFLMSINYQTLFKKYKK